jgi:cytochrome c oxidase subunit 2
MASRTKLAVVFTALVMTLTLAAEASAELGDAPDLAKGAEVFQLCAQCHGSDGAGNKLFLAPAIAGIDQWYVEMQLGEFRTGFRGLHFDDIAGMRMRPMSLTLRSDDELRDVAAYVSQLPKTKPAKTLDGDQDAGKQLYTLCAACHGPTAAGIEAMKAPALAHLDDWYLVEQLMKFKLGIRGTRPGDPYGVLMGPSSPMALTLKTDQSVRDVVAYILTLEASD